MRHSQLRAFHHVALLGGFSRAAAALNQSQPAISEQVRKLEAAHDVLLFHRVPREVRLTTAGEALFRLTRQYFEVEGQIAEQLSQSRAAVEGELRILADSAYHVTGLLSAFRAQHPNVTVTLHGGNTEEILERLRAYDAEIGVVGDIVPGGEFVSHDLGGSEIVAFAARGSVPVGKGRQSLERLLEMPLVLREPGSKTRQKLAAAAAALRLELRPAITAEGREAVRELVASGAGIGFVSRAEFGRDDRLVEIPLAGSTLEMRETIIHLAQRRDLRAIRAFMELAATLQPRG